MRKGYRTINRMILKKILPMVYQTSANAILPTYDLLCSTRMHTKYFGYLEKNNLQAIFDPDSAAFFNPSAHSSKPI